MHTSIPGFGLDFQSQLPVTAQLTISRPGWPTHINSITKGANEH